MKRSIINLLATKSDYHKTELFFLRFRRIVFISGLILFVSSLVVFIVMYNDERTITRFMNEKKILLQSLATQTDYESKLSYLSKKTSQVEQFLKDDSQFFPYYLLLTDALSQSSPSATLLSFQVDKNRDTQFKLSFNSLNQMLVSFKFIESETFLKQFEHLSLNSFSGTAEGLNSYELSFKGKFRIIHEPYE